MPYPADMAMPFRARRLAALAFAAAAAAQAQQPAVRTENWPDGAVKLRYAVDEREQKHGLCEQFAANGTRVLAAHYAHGKREGESREWTEDGKLLRAQQFFQDQLNGRSEEYAPDGSAIAAGDYRDGKRQGRWIETDPATQRRRTAEYRAGLLHGPLRVTVGEKVLSRQTWKDGELQQLDDIQPFPVPQQTLCKELAAILAQPAPADPKDPLAVARLEALHRLQAYRHLCGLPWRELVLVPEWNLRCDAAAEICRALGHLEHRPTRPPDFDPARFELGYEGASHSNLSISGSLPRSVDSYMDDSDPSNIDRIGHRRWCLNPVLRKTGFGSADGFHAMWSMDDSGKAPKGLADVFYPPRGYVPVDMFAAGRAFSIALLRGGEPKKDALVARVQALDDDYVASGAPLPLDWCSLAGGGYGGAPCLVFRARDLVVEPGRKYLVDVSTDAGKTSAFRYVVEFCARITGAGAQSGDAAGDAMK
jgi:hypothetical protein